MNNYERVKKNVPLQETGPCNTGTGRTNFVKPQNCQSIFDLAGRSAYSRFLGYDLRISTPTHYPAKENKNNQKCLMEH